MIFTFRLKFNPLIKKDSMTHLTNICNMHNCCQDKLGCYRGENSNVWNTIILLMHTSNYAGHNGLLIPAISQHSQHTLVLTFRLYCVIAWTVKNGNLEGCERFIDRGADASVSKNVLTSLENLWQRFNSLVWYVQRKKDEKVRGGE